MIWRATMNLRWEEVSGNRAELQQLWLAENGDTEWRRIRFAHEPDPDEQ